MTDLKILIISKDPTLITNIKKNIHGLNIEMDIAGDGLAGLAKARTNLYALLIMDTELPKCNGFILCRLLIFDSKYKHLEIIMTSDEPSDLELAKQMGASSFMLKNNPGQMTEHIKTLIPRSLDP